MAVRGRFLCLKEIQHNFLDTIRANMRARGIIHTDNDPLVKLTIELEKEIN